jgi:two-component system invasion response regulator UvrY
LINVLIVDDLDLVRLGIRTLLADVRGVNVVDEARDGREAIDRARALLPDVVLMDVQMPGIGGLEATRKILHFHPDVKIIVLTVCESGPFPSRFLQAGAVGYVTKDCDKKELSMAIRAVNSGQRYLSPKIAQQIAFRLISKKGHKCPFDCLSERELQVALMIANGERPVDIANMLNISQKTVNSYRYRLYDKLTIDSDVALTHLALREGLVELSEAPGVEEDS